MSRFLPIQIALAASIAFAGLSPAGAQVQACGDDGPKMLTPADTDVDIPVFSSEVSPLVMVELDGFPRTPFVLDFGSGGNLVSYDLSDRLDLPNLGASNSVDGAGDPVPGFESCFRNMRIGTVAIPNRRGTVFPYDRDDAEGIIAPSSFDGALVRFDGPASTLTVLASQTPDADWGEPVKWAGDKTDTVPLIELTFGELKIDAIVDTGSTSPIILPLSYRDKFPFLTPPEKVGELGFAANASSVPFYEAKIDGMLSAGSWSVENPVVSFADIDHPLIGWPWIRQMVFVMDPAKQLTWFPPAE